MPVAVITGGSKGLGRALALALAERGWSLVLTARGAGELAEAGRAAQGLGGVARTVAGDVADAGHRSEVVAAARALGGVDLLVNNASALGAAPLVPLAELGTAGLRAALETNVVAAHGLVREALPLLRAAGAGAVVSVSSDAAVEAYPAWGGYGASKAALDHWSAVLGVEEPGLRVWAVDPGDLRTELYRAAVPDDPDEAARPEPEAVVPAFLRLLDERPASGRYTAAALLEAAAGGAGR
ncbi:SDR family NAD(P)-dependent oxidoreductase [Streptomyces koyangensis]|uniref:SDR family NAD(P)-dependent oxidoreductase n=1 Tax=Streptomyces koyangensis TaxID=188770 RepID=UPI003C2D38EA